MVEYVLQCVKVSYKDSVHVKLPDPHDTLAVVLLVESPEVVDRILPGLPGHQFVRMPDEGETDTRGAEFEIAPVVDDVVGEVEDNQGGTK